MGLLAKWEAAVGMSLPVDGSGNELALRSKELDRANAIYAKETLSEQIKGKIIIAKPHVQKREKASVRGGQHRLSDDPEKDSGPLKSGARERESLPEREVVQWGVVGKERYRQRVGGRLNAQDDYEAEMMLAQRRV